MAVSEQKIIVASDARGFNALATSAIADGWQPHGAPFIDSNGRYAQSYIKGTLDAGVVTPAAAVDPESVTFADDLVTALTNAGLMEAP